MSVIQWNLLDTSRPFAPQRYRIGYIVRGMSRLGMTPDEQGHADCVISTGEPFGFFANEEIPMSGSRTTRRSTAGARALPATLDGMVYRYPEYLLNRPFYVDRGQAAAANLMSALLVIDVSDGERMRFEQAWYSMLVDPGMFGLIGLNCATHAAHAFSQAGLLVSSASVAGLDSPEIEGFDTPANLLRQLAVGPASGRSELYFGYLGFEPAGAGQFTVTINRR